MPPPGLFSAIGMDFSPQRPDAWAATDVERWNRYSQLRRAYQDGVDDATEDAAAQEDR